MYHINVNKYTRIDSMNLRNRLDFLDEFEGAEPTKRYITKQAKRKGHKYFVVDRARVVGPYYTHNVEDIKDELLG